MAFTDQPGAVGREPKVNDLDLQVTADGIRYRGNHFDGALAAAGGTADRVNTVEAVFLPSVNDPSLQIEVVAFNIAGDGVPGQGDGTDQDFALFCSNCLEQEDFTLTAQPIENSICRPGSAEYTVTVGSVLGYSQPVSLSTDDLPAGVTSEFSKNPVIPGESSLLTLNAQPLTSPGSSTVTIVGDSSDRHHETGVALNIYDKKPEAPTLLAPTNGSGDLPLEVQLKWSAVAQAATYDVQVASDPGFEEIVDEKMGLSGTNYTTKVLQTGQIYFWRVRSTNGCAQGEYSQPFMFSTELLPGSCPIGVEATTIYFNDFEASADDWANDGLQDTWQLSNARSHSGTTSFYAIDLAERSDQRLISPAITLPVDKGQLTLQYWNYQSLESNELDDKVCFDGAILEVTRDDGQSWEQIGGPPLDQSELISDPYHGIISVEHENPIAGKPAWCGDPQDWLNSVVRIDTWAGETVRFRFRLGSDISIGEDLGHEGWYVDDVLVQGCEVEIRTSYLPATFNPK
jgi:hypothetical protein